MIKIAFFDVDGTLLKMGHKELSERTLHALTSLHQNGVKLCMATGRGYLSAPRFPGIDFDALLTFNGSYVTVGDEIIFKCPLDRMDKLQILQNLKDMHRALAISNEHFIITNGTDPDLEQYFRFGNEMLKIDKRFDERVHEDIYQMMCSAGKKSMSGFWLVRTIHRSQHGGIERLISFPWNVGRETLCARYFSILALRRKKPSLLEMASMISRCWKQSAPVWPWGMRRMRSKPTPPVRADRWKKMESTIFV